MKSQALQELVKRIFGDEKTKQQFLKDPNSVLTQFDLTEEERKAVLNTHVQVGLVTSNSQQLEAAIQAREGWYSPTR